MKNNSKKLILNMILVLIFIGVGACALITEDYALILVLASLVFVMLMFHIMRNIYNNIFIFCFLICFFVFLLGGQILDRVFDVYGYNFAEDIELHTDLVLLISLLGIAFGYFSLGKIKFKRSDRQLIKKSNNFQYLAIVRKISKYYFWGTYLLWLLILIDNVLFVLQRGYTAYYLSYSSRIPAIIREFGYMAPVAFFIFLATMPNKKEAKFPIILYIFYLLLSLGTGRRIYFMTGILIIFAYAMLRNKVRPGDERWISKKQLIALLAIVPFLLVGMYLFEYMRSDHFVGQSSDYSPVFGFFVRQGTSINVIKYARLFSDRLNNDAYYSLYNIIKFLQNSWINDFFKLDLSFSIGRQSEMTAKVGTYLADFVSYNANSKIYAVGMGYGSCYIEELYIDFGYIGVFVGNTIYGLILNKFLKITEGEDSSVWKIAIGLFTIDAIFKAPRATFDAFIGQWLYFNSWGPLLIIFLLSYFFTKKHNKVRYLS